MLLEDKVLGISTLSFSMLLYDQLGLARRRQSLQSELCRTITGLIIIYPPPHIPLLSCFSIVKMWTIKVFPFLGKYFLNLPFTNEDMRAWALTHHNDTDISSMFVKCKFHCYGKLFDCIIYWWKFLICSRQLQLLFNINIEEI